MAKTTYGSEGYTCPYCGYEHEESYEWPKRGIGECENCEKSFRYSRDVTVVYTAEPILPESKT